MKTLVFGFCVDFYIELKSYSPFIFSCFINSAIDYCRSQANGITWRVDICVSSECQAKRVEEKLD